MDTENLYITASDFIPNEAPVFHGFFGRQGGVSTGIYSTLNCGPGSHDNPAHIHENRKVVSDTAGCAPDHLLTLYQVHGNKCIAASEPYEPNTRPRADAHVTDKKGLALGILTADCAPILFYGMKSDHSPVIGAAHAGWGGALKNVATSTITAMENLGAVRETICAAIGPSIAQGSYEVSEPFLTPFLEENPDNRQFFIPSQKPGHMMFDLIGYNAFKLRKQNIHNVTVMGVDTYTNEQDFFSYRRTTHRNEQDYGRQISVIMIAGS